MLGPLLFLVYINDLSGALESLAKLFADDTSLSPTVSGFSLSTSRLNIDLTKVSGWAYKWKMTFYSDITKQA